MDMEMTRYMFDKLGSHPLAMDITMGICLIDHYKTSGGFLTIEFEKVIGENHGKVMESLESQRLIEVVGEMIFVTKQIYNLRARAEQHFGKVYCDVITVF